LEPCFSKSSLSLSRLIDKDIFANEEREVQSAAITLKRIGAPRFELNKKDRLKFKVNKRIFSDIISKVNEQGLLTSDLWGAYYVH